MSIGQNLSESRHRTGMTQQELATKISYSRSRIANHETGQRKICKEDWPVYCNGLDDAHFTLELQRRATGGVYIPYLDGERIEHHYASLVHLSRNELKEAKEHIKQIDISKPIEEMEAHEKEHIERTLEELLDAASASLTLVIDLCNRLNLSFNQVVKKWLIGLVGKRYLKR